MVQQHLPAAITGAGIESPRQFRLRVNYRTARQTGEIDKIGFRLMRHGIFVEKGVGRGRAIGSGREKPKPWFNPTVSAHIETLADTVALHTLDELSAKILIR